MKLLTLCLLFTLVILAIGHKKGGWGNNKKGKKVIRIGKKKGGWGGGWGKKGKRELVALDDEADFAKRELEAIDEALDLDIVEPELYHKKNAKKGYITKKKPVVIKRKKPVKIQKKGKKGGWGGYGKRELEANDAELEEESFAEPELYHKKNAKKGYITKKQKATIKTKKPVKIQKKGKKGGWGGWGGYGKRELEAEDVDVQEESVSEPELYHKKGGWGGGWGNKKKGKKVIRVGKKKGGWGGGWGKKGKRELEDEDEELDDDAAEPELYHKKNAKKGYITKKQKATIKTKKPVKIQKKGKKGGWGGWGGYGKREVEAENVDVEEESVSEPELYHKKNAKKGYITKKQPAVIKRKKPVKIQKKGKKGGWGGWGGYGKRELEAEDVDIEEESVSEPELYHKKNAKKGYITKKQPAVIKRKKPVKIQKKGKKGGWGGWGGYGKRELEAEDVDVEEESISEPELYHKKGGWGGGWGNKKKGKKVIRIGKKKGGWGGGWGKKGKRELEDDDEELADDAAEPELYHKKNAKKGYITKKQKATIKTKKPVKIQKKGKKGGWGGWGGYGKRAVEDEEVDEIAAGESAGTDAEVYRKAHVEPEPKQPVVPPQPKKAVMVPEPKKPVTSPPRKQVVAPPKRPIVQPKAPVVPHPKGKTVTVGKSVHLPSGTSMDIVRPVLGY